MMSEVGKLAFQRIATTADIKVMSGSRGTACAIIAALMLGPKTRLELVYDLELSAEAVMRWLDAMKQAGLIYIVSGRKNNQGRKCKLYALQPKPFFYKDYTPSKGEEKSDERDAN